jgi:hypothetical protein
MPSAIQRLPHQIDGMAMMKRSSKSFGEDVSAVEGPRNEVEADAAQGKILLDLEDTAAEVASLAVGRTAGFL